MTEKRDATTIMVRNGSKVPISDSTLKLEGPDGWEKSIHAEFLGFTVLKTAKSMILDPQNQSPPQTTIEIVLY